MTEPFIGELRLFGFNFAPYQWAQCNGQILPIAQYNALFALLGTTYGGNGSSTFGLPDLRGRVPISFGQGPGLSNYTLGETSGVENVTLLTSQMPQHTHTTAAASAATTKNPSGAVPAFTGSGSSYGTTHDLSMSATMAGVAGSGLPHENRQPFLVLNWCIALTGLFRPGIEPVAVVGLILHLSRAGSTLVLKALGTWPGVTIVDEPPVLDDALARVRGGGDPAVLTDAVHALGDRGERVIVKTDSWHALELPRLRAACPDVPWLFVQRVPVEVLVSHAREPGSHTVPGVLSEVWFGPPAICLPLPHAARVLGEICSAVLPHAGPANLLDYAELPQALHDRVPRHFGLDPADADPTELAEVLAHHAKRPYLPFADDVAAKRAAATPALRDLAAEWVDGPYRALEGLRCGVLT